MKAMKKRTRRKLDELEKAVLRRYTRLGRAGTQFPTNNSVWLKVDQQSFQLQHLEDTDKETALWRRDMLAVALARVIRQT